MGGKGRRRREKNFLSAHGGNIRLPPPPKLRELEALPSKLRKIMEFKNPPSSTKQGPLQSQADGGNEKRRGGTAAEKKANPKDAHSSNNLERGDNIKKTTSGKHVEEKDAFTNSSSDDARKRKRKRKVVDDLRFQNLDQAAAHSRKKERKKEYFESREKKHKKEKTDDIRDFPGWEEIKFGEVVEAPPKLSFPKALKASMDASQERVRLQAVEAYRNRRGWVSRPGVQLPKLAATQSS